jgi:hypothetical protein
MEEAPVPMEAIEEEHVALPDREETEGREVTAEGLLRCSITNHPSIITTLHLFYLYPNIYI